MTRDLLVVVLAGGEGRRMGGGKPLRHLRDKSLIDHALDRAASWSPHVAVSVRSSDQVGPTGYPLLFDDPAIEGPLAGLAAALTFASQEGFERVLTLPCDMPDLPDDLARRLDEALSNGAGVAVASCEGRLHPVCAAWKVVALAGLSDYRAGGRSSVRGFANVVGEEVVTWDDGFATAFENINTPIDLARSAGGRLY